MPYVRLSLMHPVPGREAEVEDLNRELIALYSEQHGFLESRFIRATTGSNEVGRVTFWESAGAADAAAISDRSMSLRSRLHQLVQRGHQDRLFLTE
jgi:heme-degrading monooxygenase HmoA